MADWIVIVDDEDMSLKMAGHILSKHDKRVTTLKTGQLLLDYLKNNTPDLILLDINMPEMDGFETFIRLRTMQEELRMEKIPVVFLTAEEAAEAEARSFEMGISDYIRKPFNPDDLIRRIDNIIAKHKSSIQTPNEVTKDPLTGLMTNAAIQDKLGVICRRQAGCFMMIELDSFEAFEETYGQDDGADLLLSFTELLKKELGESSIIGRMDKAVFSAFCPELSSKNDIKRLSVSLNSGLGEAAKSLVDGPADMPLGVSLGVMFVSGIGSDFTEIHRLTCRALETAKQTGRHDYMIYDLSGDAEAEDAQKVSLKTLSMILSERNIDGSVLQLDMDSFTYIYRFVMKNILRYHRTACKILFTFAPAVNTGNVDESLCDGFFNHVRNMAGKNDLLLRYRTDQLFLFLTDIKEEAIPQTISNIIRSWAMENGTVLSITYEAEYIASEEEKSSDETYPWVIVVDDDVSNLKIAGHVLSRNKMRVTALRSGRALLEFVKENRPDLILLDVEMPEMDGFETLEGLKTMDAEVAEIPVIFLTGRDDQAAETKGLKLGAMDFIRKPFAPEILCMRVKHCIDLTRLQKNLEIEVDRKSKENERLFTHVIKSLADAIDAKDKYTNGHSGRVAEYSKEIARRYGYSPAEQNSIYMMGLLHDVGKIGVPDAVINKAGKLTEEEFEMIKKHPVIGSQILENISEMPELSTGARWHHEKYGGGGYPDGLKGEDIAEAARIIAVADAYDAMTSNRSYREVMPQDKVRAEMERCKGSQFDPRFADIMIRMIDEDTEYRMREVGDEKKI